MAFYTPVYKIYFIVIIKCFLIVNNFRDTIIITYDFRII